MTTCPECAGPVPPGKQPRIYCSKRCQQVAKEKRRPPRPGRIQPPRPGRKQAPRPGRKRAPRPGRKRAPRPGRKRAPQPRIVRTLLTIDSETVTDPDGTTRLTLIACSDNSYLQGDDIRTEEALRYVSTRDGELWSFYGDYDINYWIRDLPTEALDRLRTTNWVGYGPWRIHHIPRRIFQLWDRENGRYVCMYDVYPYVQSSYVSWLTDWNLAPADVIERIYKMKLLRDRFVDETAEDILTYTRSEIEYMKVGVEELKRRITASGYHPVRWMGPGSVAASALRQHRVKDHYPTSNPLIEDIADQAYYGGRVETSIVGPWRNPIYSYDINSAYPAAMVDLPCLACSTWQATNDIPNAGATALVEVSWTAPDGQWWGPLPARPRPYIPLRYRSQGRGWYWWHEVEPWLVGHSTFRIPSDRYTWDVRQAYVLPPACDHKPMSWVSEMYTARQEMKAAGDPLEYVYKLILNSAYGKLAQKVGKPPFRNIIWAGMITARTRARLGKILARYQADILMVATDGIYSSTPLDLPLSDELGAWSDSGIYQWADIWQPGFYLLDDNKIRSRGFIARDIDWQDFRQAWADWNYAGQVPITRKQALGYRLATAQHKVSQIGIWTEKTSIVSFDPWPRREPIDNTYYNPDGTDYIRTTAPVIELVPDKDLTKESLAYAASRQWADYSEDGDPIGTYRD